MTIAKICPDIVEEFRQGYGRWFKDTGKKDEEGKHIFECNDKKLDEDNAKLGMVPK